MSLVAICISSLEKRLFQCSVHFYLFLKLKDLAVPHLWGCEWAFSSCSEWKLLSSCCTRASPRSGRFSRGRARALERSLRRCGAWAYLLHGIWNLPRPGIEPESPALAGGFLTPGAIMEVPLCSFLNQIAWMFAIRLNELFIYFGCQPLIRYIASKYSLPFSRLSVHFVDGSFTVRSPHTFTSSVDTTKPLYVRSLPETGLWPLNSLGAK